MGKKFIGSTLSESIAETLAFSQLIEQRPAACPDGVKYFDYAICITVDASHFTDEQLLTAVRDYFCYNSEVVDQWNDYRAECRVCLQEPLSYAGSFVSRKRFGRQRTLVIRMSGQLD